MSELEVTPMHDLKPKLEWVGKILGMDVYIDTSGKHPAKRDIAEELISKLSAQQASSVEEGRNI